MSICDFIFSADLCVGSASKTLGALIDQIGLGQPPADAYIQYPQAGWDVVFAPVNPMTATAPTRLEIMAVLDGAGNGTPSMARSVYTSQAPRLWRTHGLVVVTSQLEALVERVRRSGARHWFEAPPAGKGFAKLWMGIADESHLDYQPSADGGFMFEFIPFGASAFAPKHIDPAPDQPRPGEVGMRRIVHRSFLVDDIDARLRRLEEVFSWRPAHDVRSEPARGYRFVDMSCNHAQGARLRLVQPTDPDSRAGRDMAAHGVGPYTITISVFDLDATASDLNLRGTDFARLEAGAHEPETLILTSDRLGAPFCFIPDRSD